MYLDHSSFGSDREGGKVLLWHDFTQEDGSKDGGKRAPVSNHFTCSKVKLGPRLRTYDAPLLDVALIERVAQERAHVRGTVKSACVHMGKGETKQSLQLTLSIKRIWVFNINITAYRLHQRRAEAVARPARRGLVHWRRCPWR